MERQNDADRRNLEDRKVKFAVIYYSKTGHTREMGEEIAEGIRKQGGEVKLFSIEEPLDNEYISECGGVIFGTPVYLANTCWQMKKWFDTESASVKLAGKLGGVYSTAHFAQGGGDVALMCSDSTSARIDAMVVALVKRGYEKAVGIISKNMPKLHELAKYLYEKETITGEEFMEILSRKPEELTTTKFENSGAEEAVDPE